MQSSHRPGINLKRPFAVLRKMQEVKGGKMGQTMKAFGDLFSECDHGGLGGWCVYLSEPDGKHTPHAADDGRTFGLTSKKSAIER